MIIGYLPEFKKEYSVLDAVMGLSLELDLDVYNVMSVMDSYHLLAQEMKLLTGHAEAAIKKEVVKSVLPFLMT